MRRWDLEKGIWLVFSTREEIKPSLLLASKVPF
jgi:hypothetical protein